MGSGPAAADGVERTRRLGVAGDSSGRRTTAVARGRHVTGGPGRPTIRGHQVALGTTSRGRCGQAPAAASSCGAPRSTPTPGSESGHASAGRPDRGSVQRLGAAPPDRRRSQRRRRRGPGSPRRGRTTTQPFTSDYQFEMGGDRSCTHRTVARSAGSSARSGGPSLTWQTVSGLRRAPRAAAYARSTPSGCWCGAAGGWYLVGPDQTVRTDLPTRADVFEVADGDPRHLVADHGRWPPVPRSSDGAHCDVRSPDPPSVGRMDRQHARSGSPYEETMGFSRAVRVGTRSPSPARRRSGPTGQVGPRPRRPGTAVLGDRARRARGARRAGRRRRPHAAVRRSRRRRGRVGAVHGEVFGRCARRARWSSSPGCSTHAGSSRSSWTRS